MLKRLSLSFIMLVLLSVPVFAQDDMDFDVTPCPLEIPFGFVEDVGPSGIECGFIEVPEFHAEPDGNTIRLMVAVIHSSDPTPEADPVFMEQGGPGAGSIDTFVTLAPLLASILAERDVVVVDQRGTGYSEPSLKCDEITELALDTIDDSDATIETLIPFEIEAFEACFDRLEADGVNLAAFNSVENAADMITVADVLGYDQINFYGVSYGTMLGQHLLRDFEPRIRSIVFDAVVPLEYNFMPDVLRTGADARMALFETCAADEFCNDLYPDLETIFWQVYDDLNASPAIIPVTDGETGDVYDAVIDGNDFAELFRSIEYITSYVPSLPAFVYAAAEGDYEWIERLYSLIILGSAREIAHAMNVSVLCAEDADFTVDDLTTEGVSPDILEAQRESITSLPELCELANIPALDNYVDDPVVSDVPALLTSGQFDPITPARYGDILAGNLSNSTHVVFPSVGHGAVLGGLCPITIMAAFISDPTEAIDTDCVDSMTLEFIELVTDPTGQLQFAKPAGLEDVSTDDVATFANDDITLSIVPVDTEDLDEAFDTGLSLAVREGFDVPPLQEIVQQDSTGTATIRLYQDGTNIVIAIAVEVEGLLSVVVAQFPPAQLAAIDPILTPLLSNMFQVE